MAKPQIEMSSLSKAHWSEEQHAKAALVIEFVQKLMNEHDFAALAQRYAGRGYKQHNRNIADGIGGVLDAVGDLVKRAPEFSYDVKQLLVDGDFVVIHSHATLKAKHRGDDRQGFNIIDTWKVEEGFLTEHWDAVQGMSFSMRLYSLVTGGALRNSNGVY